MPHSSVQSDRRLSGESPSDKASGPRSTLPRQSSRNTTTNGGSAGLAIKPRGEISQAARSSLRDPPLALQGNDIRGKNSDADDIRSPKEGSIAVTIQRDFLGDSPPKLLYSADASRVVPENTTQSPAAGTRLVTVTRTHTKSNPDRLSQESASRELIASHQEMPDALLLEPRGVVKLSLFLSKKLPSDDPIQRKVAREAALVLKSDLGRSNGSTDYSDGFTHGYEESLQRLESQQKVYDTKIDNVLHLLSVMTLSAGGYQSNRDLPSARVTNRGVGLTLEWDRDPARDQMVWGMSPQLEWEESGSPSMAVADRRIDRDPRKPRHPRILLPISQDNRVILHMTQPRILPLPLDKRQTFQIQGPIILQKTLNPRSSSQVVPLHFPLAQGTREGLASLPDSKLIEFRKGRSPEVTEKFGEDRSRARSRNTRQRNLLSLALRTLVGLDSRRSTKGGIPILLVLR